jgi:hypothetical protein
MRYFISISKDNYPNIKAFAKTNNEKLAVVLTEYLDEVPLWRYWVMRIFGL